MFRSNGRRLCAWAAVCAGLLVALPRAAVAGDVRNLRSIQVPDSTMVISLWDSVSPTGEVTPWYAVAFDGQQFTEPQATSYDILLWYREFEPLLAEPEVPALLAAGPDTNVYIVQFYTQPFDTYRSQIEALGGTINRYVAHNAHAVTMSPAVRDQVAALPYVRWIGAYHPAYRLDARIREDIVLNAPELEPGRYSIEVMARGPAQQTAVAGLIEALGGSVHFITPEGFRMEATMSRAALLQVVRLDEINFIDPWGGPGEVDMNNARGPAGHNANFIQSTLGFNGEGVRGEVFDTGVRATHQAFQNPAILLHTQNSTDTSHGTSTYGEVFGNGAANPSGTGMCPNREQGIFAYYKQVTQFGGTKTRHQHTAELVDPNGPYRAVFQTSSVGSTWTTTYTTISAEVDDYLFLYDLLSCQSQSNTGNQQSRPQAWAKNIVAVGGFYHYDNANRADDKWNGGASVGPAADGRIKPDLAAYYDEILTTSNSSDTSYTTGFSGTSGATPMTAGAFGLLFQMWHNGVWPGHGGASSVFASRCHMATAKALMINSAYQYPLAGETGYTDLTRVRQGWGQAFLEDLYKQSLKSFVIDETDLLLPLETRTYLCNVTPGTAALKATLVYTDPQGNPAVQTQHRINDLTLKVIRPDGTYYYGNNGLSTARWSTSGGAPNTKDTVENVFIQNPMAGVWQVQVIGAEIVQDSHLETPGVTDADYALVVTGATPMVKGDLNCDGVVTFSDVNPFVLAISDPAGYAAQYPNCDINLGDINGDGAVNFGDVMPFVELLSG